MGGSVSSASSVSDYLPDESGSHSQNTEGACLQQQLDTCCQTGETLKETSFANSASGCSLHESCSDSQNTEGACLGQELDTSYDTEDDDLHISFLDMREELMDISFLDMREELMVQELETEHREVLHGCVSDKQMCGTYRTYVLGENCREEEGQTPPLDGYMQRVFVNCETFPLSDIVQLHPSSIVEEELTGWDMTNEHLLKTETPVNADSIPLPTPLKLRSALKGSHGQQGLTQESKLSVKWAPDVYDPPVTSDSHTVKDSSHSSKSKRNAQYKHKHGKGRSSRGSSSSSSSITHRKSAIKRSPRNAIDSPFSKWAEAPFVDLKHGIGHPHGEVLDYTAVSPESKCGSSFYMVSLSKAHARLAEASLV